MINPCFPQNKCSAYSNEYLIWSPVAFRFCPIASMLSTATQLCFLHFSHLQLNAILLPVIESVNQCACVLSHSSLGALSVSYALCLVCPLSHAINLSHSLSRVLSVSHSFVSCVLCLSLFVSPLSVFHAVCLMHPLSHAPFVPHTLSCVPTVLCNLFCPVCPFCPACPFCPVCSMCPMCPLSCAIFIPCALCSMHPLSCMPSYVYYTFFSHPFSCTFCPSSSLALCCLLIGCGGC